MLPSLAAVVPEGMMQLKRGGRRVAEGTAAGRPENEAACWRYGHVTA